MQQSLQCYGHSARFQRPRTAFWTFLWIEALITNKQNCLVFEPQPGRYSLKTSSPLLTMWPYGLHTIVWDPKTKMWQHATQYYGSLWISPPRPQRTAVTKLPSPCSWFPSPNPNGPGGSQWLLTPRKTEKKSIHCLRSGYHQKTRVIHFIFEYEFEKKIETKKI